MRIYKEFFFEAAHFLPSAPPGHPNARVHGHSFRARITVDGQPDEETGIIIHFGELEAAVQDAKDALAAAAMGDPNASIPTPQPVHYRPMFGAMGLAAAITSVTFTSQAALDAGVPEQIGLNDLVGFRIRLLGRQEGLQVLKDPHIM